MAFAAHALDLASKLLAESTYDIAAGISDATLTDFLDAHWKSESASPNSVYKGLGRAEELAITWTYEVRAPATIDLAPISQAAFSRLYRGWMITVPELARFVAVPAKAARNQLGTLSDVPPANVQVKVPRLFVNIKTDDGITVDFEYSMTITGFLEIITINGARILKITPIAAKIDDPRAIEAMIRSVVPLGTQALKTDCVALEKLFKYILNVLIANRIGSFIREFGLPVAIEIADGVSLTDIGLSVVENLVVLMARIGKVTPLTDTEYHRVLDSAEPALLKEYGKRSSGAASWTAARADVLSVKALDTSAEWPQRGIFLIMHERLFQAFASTVGINTTSEHCTGVFGLKACYGYSLRIWGAVAKVVSSGLDVSANFAGSGWVKGCIDTHCGDKCASVSASPSAVPKFSSQFSFVNRELWVTAEPRMFTISWNVGGLPWPFSQLIDWFLDAISYVGIAVVNALGLQWKRRLTTLPALFPGTNLEYDPKFDRDIYADTSRPALILLGELDFKP